MLFRSGRVPGSETGASQEAARVWDAPDYIRHDRKFYFPFEMLAKADRMTMANSVEGRVPFAAPEVQELAARLPFSVMVRDGELKWILRRTFADKLPAGVAKEIRLPNGSSFASRRILGQRK